MFQFESLSAFLQMGGHGVYVWMGYGVSLGILAWLALSPLSRRRTLLRQLARDIKRQEAINKQEGQN